MRCFSCDICGTKVEAETRLYTLNNLYQTADIKEVCYVCFKTIDLLVQKVTSKNRLVLQKEVTTLLEALKQTKQ